MPSTPIANFDAGQIPDVSDEVNFHSDATYVFEHMASEIIPGINTNLDWMNAALAGSETLVDAVADLEDLVGGTTAFAKTLLDDADAPTARATLGLGSAAVLGAGDQSTWDTGTSTTERVISPDKLTKTLEYRGLSEPPLGVGQAWTDVSGSRSGGVSYQNTTGRTIAVMTYRDNSNSSTFAKVSADNVTWVGVAAGSYGSGSFIVPSGHYYKDDNSPTKWTELR